MKAVSSAASHQRRHHVDSILQFVENAGHSSGFPADNLIGRSWHRCLTDYGLDPTRPRPARIVTSQTLREHQDSVDEFLNVARAGVEQLYRQIAHLGYVLLLSDHRGITVQYLGDKNSDSRLRQAGLYLGADWSEQYAGTCAVGTCIQERQALTCHRIDHFDSTHIELTCTAVPICDPQGNLLAVLDISALNSPHARDSQTFALHLTQLYARLIEDAFFLRRYRNERIFRADRSRELVQVNGQMLLALDDNGTILAANTSAREFVKLQLALGQDNRLPTLLDCEWRDILGITLESADGVRAFRTAVTGETLYGTLIEPQRRVIDTKLTPVQDIEPLPALDCLAADDPAMRRTLSLARRLRNRDVSLLILGETGTGKEVLSRAVHDTSQRAGNAFIAVNCAAIPESLIESELFGYAPGTFTGGRAKGSRGLIQQAHGGTLFLDEIGDMPLPLQTRLLRVLAEGEVMPLGAIQPVKVDCRIIAATHCDLPTLVQEGRFRSDLYYRLCGAILKLPPLRERADKHYVIQAVLERLVSDQQLPAVRLRADAMSALLACDWPGNIRQLVNVLAFAEATCSNAEITAQDLPEEFLNSRQTGLQAGTRQTAGTRTYPQYQSHPQSETQPLLPMMVDENSLQNTRSDANNTTNTGHYAGSDASRLRDALLLYGDNISEVARTLGISRPTVYRRIRKYGISQSRHRYLI
jgi:sigma-54 dependent transcriptional regulator, acetoin dehydrogenase operon transcriptional activator AcoR